MLKGAFCRTRVARFIRLSHTPSSGRATNLVDVLRSEAVPRSALYKNHGALLELVRLLIGVVPNCDPYLEIWPAAFRTYNMLPPNLLNLPRGLFAPDPAVGLGMYVSSRAAECAYCAAHTSSFALRRGASPSTIAHAMDDDPQLSPLDRAVIAVAKKLSTVPVAVTDADRAALIAACGAERAEWVVHGIAMMGFLNKVMDALGVELEPEVTAEVAALITASGWSPGKHGELPARFTPQPPKDSLLTKLRVLPLLPAALRFDRECTRGVPDRWPAVGDFLRERTGCAFSVLGRVRHRGPVRALAAVLALNFTCDGSSAAAGLDASTTSGASTVLGHATKRAAVIAYAEHVGNATLASELAQLRVPAAAAGGSGGGVDAAAAAMVVARAIAPSPAVVDSEAIAAARSLRPAAVVELVTAIAVAQLVHRLGSFYI